MQTETSEGPRTLRVRKMDFPFKSAGVPRWWLHGNPVLTHAANGLNLLFPPGERFFIRSVKHYLDRIQDDPELVARVKAFFGQEGRHGHEHERFNAILEAQGYDLEKFLRVYQKLAFAGIERVAPPILRLSATVALEHFTATMARTGLQARFLDGAHPVVAELLRWHAAEEIEHKSVAWDVLQRVDPRYSVRVAGLAVATTQLLGWWMVATTYLLSQEKLTARERRAYAREGRRVREETGGMTRRKLFREAILEYLERDFHPDRHDDYALARDYLRSVGAEA
ncbi:MAG: metal-dependent hydrolase [Sandaracinaceae bacterium]|nr:metal-dependent hydrolase [Sandaracinaceae bacterium]